MRNERKNDSLRKVEIIKDYISHPEGSVLVAFGDTKVICNASVSEGVPPFLRDSGTGWVTAEYAMLPRATHTRNQRESKRGKQDGRSQEISRLIGRSLRAAVDFEKLGENTVTIDCDVIQADGGTRTAAITGGFCALYMACEWMIKQGMIAENPVTGMVSAISVGIVMGEPMLDLEYAEDSIADVDMNLVVKDNAEIVEIQGSAEKVAFDRDLLNKMLDLGFKGIKELTDIQKQVIK
ncbi:ribonuclease PH [Denitrovibrio acetiphilus DSM 12809]|uniref:Ribonuclease PH n=1 Tax=Denitrovibrio acetiphilus (strain DSM 12809 / NBRC 114555 / N2460) TaxID=522772 RepID=D4H1B4_DENA2|nr:ribonuclease PH [Denitrovibrio acetiphilus]ADD66862.1 ribonuclease PH [Denitrovibrio acetiphilus DSM 12809]